jgi:hypothetical protein
MNWHIVIGMAIGIHMTLLVEHFFAQSSTTKTTNKLFDAQQMNITSKLGKALFGWSNELSLSHQAHWRWTHSVLDHDRRYRSAHAARATRQGDLGASV